ncbi:response regulator transcription factor [Amycolatopsis pigmentata]|uniref:Response regulator n=1 Tax=Amycolatopsis pigmentata TaxID=450801 RepID=A0ABW5G5R0_9PSEU
MSDALPIRVLLADDQSLIRMGLRGVLESEPGFTVVGEAGDGAAAVQAVRAGDVDIVLMDLRMPGVDGIEATRQLTADPGASPGVAILVLTTFETDEYVLRALTAGARGYLGKDADPEVLLAAIRVVARGSTLLSPRATRALIARAITPGALDPRAAEALATLTGREREIAGLAARGLTNGEIAERLVISPFTVKTHINRAMAKLGARDRAALVIALHAGGAVEIPPTQ